MKYIPVNTRTHIWHSHMKYMPVISPNCFKIDVTKDHQTIGPLHDPVTWYKSHMLVSKMHSGTSKTMQLVPVHLDLPLFWKSHILHHETGSCKGPISLKKKLKTLGSRAQFRSRALFRFVHLSCFETVSNVLWAPVWRKNPRTDCARLKTNLRDFYEWYKLSFYFIILTVFNSIRDKYILPVGPHWRH